MGRDCGDREVHLAGAGDPPEVVSRETGRARRTQERGLGNRSWPEGQPGRDGHTAWE